MKAIAIIEDEHRAITAVVEGLRHLLAEARAGTMQSDAKVLGAVFHYIEQFPERLHHPKEDDFLFDRLRARRPDVAPLVDALHREHVIGRERFDDLKRMHERYVADPSTIDAFADAVDRYAQFHWEHMRREEQEVLPVAVQSLTDEDWAHIDAAFASNSDPIVGVPARKAFRELFRRLVALLPPPYGVGPEA